MKRPGWGSVLALAFSVTGPGCTNTPGGPSVSFTRPAASGPANGVSYKFKEQPITLTITNATRTAPGTTTYSVEVATDAGFASKVYTKDGIAEGNGGTTSVTVGNLGGNATYYWHARAVVDGFASPASATQSFVVQQQIVVNAPVVSEPANGLTTSEVRPTFVTQNATRQGAVGPIAYLFQVSTSLTFSTITAGAIVQEQSGGQTSWTPATDLPAGTLFWRVQASDPSNTETSSFSSPASFVVEPFNIKDAIIHNNPPDMWSWPETAKITRVDFGPYIYVDFDRRTGPGKWPESSIGDGSSGTIQYTLGMCFKLGGKWHCSAVTRFWDGRDLEAGGLPDMIANHWYYDSRWGPMNGHQPAQGEIIGIFAGQGNLRDNTTGTNTYKERTNVVFVPFGTSYRR